ncbi:unnamed protein product [Ilex paraguariensis]|uniref:Uncharacterized protein n=1 Tax=Ilex paraguariensis TaxID=185542 RepID=A0ABC8SD24_9AQUA
MGEMRCQGQKHSFLSQVNHKDESEVVVGSVAANVSVYKSIPRAPLVDKGKRKCNRKKVGPPPKEDWMIKEAGSDLKRKREENELLVFFDHCPKKKVSHEFFDSHSVLQSVETVNQSHRESW